MNGTHARADKPRPIKIFLIKVDLVKVDCITDIDDALERALRAIIAAQNF